MRVKIKRHWRRYAPGEVTDDLPDGVGRTLIDRHIAEPVLSKAVDAPPRDKSVRRASVRRK